MDPNRRSRTRLPRITVAHYDVSSICNLKCEGCYFYDVPLTALNPDSETPEAWDRFFASERVRGVNLAMLAGAEPSLLLDRLRIAQRHIPYGVVYTNGVRRVPDDIRYKIHLSAWGVGNTDRDVRGVESFSRALENYRDDGRAIVFFTISPLSVGDIVPAARLAHEHGLPITYSYYSPSMNYNEKIRRGEKNDDQFFRISSESRHLGLSRADFRAARKEIERAMDQFPKTVWYSLYFDEWVTRDNPHEVDQETGIARDCGVRLSGQVNYRVDFTSNMKCGSPQTECSTCRGAGPNYATYFMLRRQADQLPGGVAGWYETRTIWNRLFIPEELQVNQMAHQAA